MAANEAESLDAVAPNNQSLIHGEACGRKKSGCVWKMKGNPPQKKNTVYHVFTIQIVLSVYPIYRHKNLELSVAVWLTNKHRVRQTKIGDEPTRCQRLVWRVCDLNPGDTPSG